MLPTRWRRKPAGTEIKSLSPMYKQSTKINHVTKLQSVCSSCWWQWLGPYLSTIWYVMYFRFVLDNVIFAHNRERKCAENYNKLHNKSDKIASVYFIWKIYLYFSIGNSQSCEPALCQLYRHTFVPYDQECAMRKGSILFEIIIVRDGVLSLPTRFSRYLIDNVLSSVYV